MTRTLAIAASILTIISFAARADGHQLVIAAGYANSGTPEHGSGVSDYVFDAGGGYAAGVRVDLEKPHFWFGPAFTFWNNLTGDPSPNANSSYFQAELGGRFSARTRTVPAIYCGVGAGYTFSHGEFVDELYRTKQAFDGEFPTGSVHFGVKTPSQSHGLGLIAEAAYSFPLGKPDGEQSVGPARAFMVQIGLAFDIRSADDRGTE